MMLINLLIITCLIVFVIDLSGFVDSAEDALSKWLGHTAKIPKPFSCSLCMTWWIGLVYLIISSSMTWLWIGGVALCSFLTPVIGEVLMTVRDLGLGFFAWLHKALHI